MMVKKNIRTFGLFVVHLMFVDNYLFVPKPHSAFQGSRTKSLNLADDLIDVSGTSVLCIETVAHDTKQNHQQNHCFCHMSLFKDY